MAQEIKQAIDNHPEIKETSIWFEDCKGVQEVGKTALIPMLVKSIQELSAEIEKLKKEK